MRTFPAAVATLLSSGSRALIHDLWTFRCVTGLVLQWTNGDVDHGAFSCSGPVVRRKKIRWVAGTEVGTATLTLEAGDGYTLPGDGRRLGQALADGLFRGAYVQMDRLYLDATGAPVGTVEKWWCGSVADVRPDSTGGEITCEDGRGKLRRKNVPVRAFAPTCPWALFSPGCGLDPTGRVQSCTVATVTDRSRFTVSGGPYADMPWGVATFAGGPNVGVAATIDSIAGTLVSLKRPLPYLPVAGDPLTLSPNCQKTLDACTAFGNQGRFGGQPYVPRPESAR